ncbi:hypothetical protein A2U01_0068303, partial [Trifolium medium]|nr:hypothetical protein [Trifolium medium]
CCNRKRLTLTPHYDPRVEDFVISEVLSVFKSFEEEQAKAEAEKRRLKEEEKKKKEEEKKKLEEQQKILYLNIAQEDKGNEVATELHPLVLVLQEQLAAQKVEQEK